jgi:RNA polymerase sigma-70 factor, ECF subfamily
MYRSVNGAEAARLVLGAEALFRAHALYVVRLLARLGAPPAEIDDLVQEVFLTAHRRGGFVPDQAKATTWLAEIALRVVSTARRTRRRRRTEADDGAIERTAAPGTGPFEAAAAAEALTRVNRALDALDLDHRAVFVLFELDGESCDAIAAALGVPVGTVYSRLHAARRAVRRAYESETMSPHLREEGGLA